MTQTAARAGLLLGLVCTAVCCQPHGGAVKDSDGGSDTGTQQQGPWTLGDLGGACPSAERLGGFELAQWDSPLDGFSTITGSVRDGVIPSTVLFERQTSGDCVLYQRENPYCDPVCGASETCNHDGDCVDFPLQMDLGDVAIEGLVDSPLTLSVNATNMYSQTLLSYPLFAPQAQIRLQTAGGQASPLTLHGLGVAPLEVPSPTWNIQANTDLQVSWTPAEGESRIFLSIDIDQHGNSPASLVCETDDDGILAIDGALVDALVAYGVSGFATGTMERRTADRTTLGAGCVELLVYSQIPTDITVEGHTPCFNNQDCPPEQHCDQAMNSCVDNR